MQMPKVFTFIIQNDKQGKYFHQGRAMHIMAGIFLICYGMPYLINIQHEWMMPIAIILPALTILAISLFKYSLILDVNNNRVFRILEAGFLMMGSMHYLQSNQIFPAILFALVSIIMLFLLKLESRIFQNRFLYIMPKGIEIELPLHSKLISWNEIEKVLFVNEHITIHFVSQQQIQVKVKHHMNEIELLEFTEFVKAKTSSV